MADAENDPGNDPRRAAWSSYWAQGALHSCVGSFDAGYAGAIGDFWDAFFADLPPGARVLDLATGNGALPLRLKQRQGAPGDLRIDAVDLATLAPSWHRPETDAGIRFHQGVAMESLPFADGTFDRVASQFGFEYARRREASAECVRVARAGASFGFVLHHADSVLVSVGRAELANQERLLAPDGLLEATGRVLPWIARARAGAAPGSAAAAARADYNAAMSQLSAAIASSAVPDALVEARGHMHALVAGVSEATLQAGLDAIAAYREAMSAAALRTREMIEHALDAAEVEALATYFEAACPGCTARYAPLVQPEGVLAWGLVVSPADEPSTSSKGPSDPA